MVLFLQDKCDFQVHQRRFDFHILSSKYETLHLVFRTPITPGEHMTILSKGIPKRKVSSFLTRNDITDLRGVLSARNYCTNSRESCLKALRFLSYYSPNAKTTENVYATNFKNGYWFECAFSDQYYFYLALQGIVR